MADIKAGFQDSPVVLVNGARQVGKSTLAERICKEFYASFVDNVLSKEEVRYITFDDITVLAAAKASPVTFLEGLPRHVVIDEIQRVPELFLAIKRLVDQDKQPGRFFLTGSANVLTLPKLADSLAGRMDIHTLWPLSQGEIEGKKEGFIDACFSNKALAQVAMVPWPELVGRIVSGGYPEILKRQEDKRRRAWYSSYLSSVLERDIRSLANIEGLKEVPDLLQLLAVRVGGILNFSEISRISKISQATLKRYIALLGSVFLYVPLPAWFKNEEKRLIKSPKIYLNDTGLVAYLRGLDHARLVADRQIAGFLLENFVMMELKKQCSWNNIVPKLYHFHTSSGNEVDMVMEAPDGRVVAIEVKSKSEVSERDFAGIKVLAEITKNAFHRGIVLYTGQETVNFGEQLTALPLSALWQIVEQPI